jgi:hypothetical protein
VSLSFSREQIRDFLKQAGYSTHPDGLIHFFLHDYDVESDDTAYLDINAEAVREGDVVPDRPIRIKFLKVTSPDRLPRWQLKSVEELPVGVQSRALDRQRDTPKISPWSNQ